MAVQSKYKTNDNIFIDNNLEQRKKYECPQCGYLLRDAVQTSCGHWLCLECAKQLFKNNSRPLCPRVECGEKLAIEDDKEYFPDKFVRRQIGKFLVRCRYYKNECEWTGPLVEQLKHIEACIYEQEECTHCHEYYDKAKLEEHERNCPQALVNCPYIQYGCEITKKMTRVECDKHLESEVAHHLKIVVPILQKLSKETDKYSSMPSPALCRGNNSNQQLLSSTVQTDGAASPRNSISTSFNPDLDSLRKQLATKENQIRHLQDKLLQVEATVLSKTTENEDRDFRLSLMENSNYDGTMLWKIPQFTQRMEDARTGKYTSIFSLPFYSGRYGYKMCLRLYILGDGIGKTSHMSLFFVLMKGEFDNILQWPFNHKVTFKLINQCGGRDVIDIFQPDPLSSSFQKPKTDMNIASGCPRFVSLNELMQNGFIVEDTVFIKVKVDVTMMKHP